MLPFIVTAEHAYARRGPAEQAPVAERAALLHRRANAEHPNGGLWQRRGRPAATAATAIEAYVNWGRWVADCPTPGCNGALIVSHEDPRFYCPYCFNDPEAGRFLAVAFPAARAAIEAELLKRPLLEQRNWRPGETAADLRRQNSARGIR